MFIRRPFLRFLSTTSIVFCAALLSVVPAIGAGSASAQPTNGPLARTVEAEDLRERSREEPLPPRPLRRPSPKRGAVLEAGSSSPHGDQVQPSLLTPAASDLTGVYDSSTSIADINGDGNLDLLITGDSNSDLKGRTYTTTLYLGDGQGGFTKANAGLPGVIGGSTSVADVNGDGNQDLLITGRDANSQSNKIAMLYLGDGQGGFTETEADLPGVNYGPSTSIADVNGDENPDILITGFTEDLTAALYLGDGQGGFTEAEAGLKGVRFSSTSIADVNGDGDPDLLITGEEFIKRKKNPTATLYLGDGQGGFSTANAGLTGVAGGSTSIADVDGDGNLDLLVTGDSGSGDTLNPSATLYLGDGNGGFTRANAGLPGVKDGSTSIADVNEDGNQDLLVTGNAGGGEILPAATLYLGQGEGALSEANAGLTGVESGSTSIADVNGDGNPDLLITGNASESITEQKPTATLYLGNGQGNFTKAGAN